MDELGRNRIGARVFGVVAQVVIDFEMILILIYYKYVCEMDKGNNNKEQEKTPSGREHHEEPR